MPNPANMQPELSGEHAPSVSELSTRTERSPINIPRRNMVPASESIDVYIDPHTGERSSIEETMARSNLDLSRGPGGPPRNNRHVMSWMNYDGRLPGPAR